MKCLELRFAVYCLCAALCYLYIGSLLPIIMGHSDRHARDGTRYLREWGWDEQRLFNFVPARGYNTRIASVRIAIRVRFAVDSVR